MSDNPETQPYNRCAPRVRQAEHRAAKGQYRPKGIRATHHVGHRALKGTTHDEA
jgi:hypothetical protein